MSTDCGNGNTKAPGNLASVESTLELAAELGWVKDKAQYDAVREGYLMEVSNQQLQTDGTGGGDEPPVPAAGAAAGNALRRSHDKPLPKGGSSSSAAAVTGGGVNSSAGNSANNSSRVQNTSSASGTNKQFEYSKLHSQQALGALPGAKDKDKDKDGRSKGFSGKTKQEVSGNPYLYKSK